MAHDGAGRLYLAVEAGIDASHVAALLAGGDVAALLICAPTGTGLLTAHIAKPLVEAAQAHGVAAIIEADAKLARTLRADGVHLPAGKDVVARYHEAREVLGGRFIVGADAGRSRHDAITLGEAGADYVGFGIPAHVEDRESARARRRDLVAWWSEIVEVPCVACDVETLEDAADLAAVGADFVALRAPSDAPPRWIEDAKRALAEPEAAA